MPNVTYGNLEQVITDLNVMKAGSTQFEYRTVPKNAKNSPEPQNEGMCVMIPFHTRDSSGNPNGNYSMQLYYALSGNIYSRTFSNVYGQHNFGEWERVDNTGGSSSPVDLSNYLKKPEAQEQITNIDEPTESGFMKTGDKTVAGNLPSGVSAKWGLVVNLFENTGNGTMFQMWFSLSGNTKGHRYTRGRENGVWTPWVDISSGGSSVNNVWEFPEDQAITAVTGQLETGYYKTTETTTGMEGVPSGRKDGILKVIKDDNLSIQEYSPSKEGDNGYFLRTIPVAVTTRAVKPFEEMKTESSHLTIHNTRGNAVPHPNEYKNHASSQKGFVVYEWKMTEVDGFNPPAGETGKRCILCTMEPAPKDAVTGGEFDDITQIAYIIDGKTYIRHGSPTNDSWLPWKPLGGSSTPVDNFIEQLTTELQKWISQPDTASRAFEDYHKQKVIAMFNSWTQ